MMRWKAKRGNKKSKATEKNENTEADIIKKRSREE